MQRTAGVAWSLVMFGLAPSAAAAQTAAASESKPISITATIEAIDQANRVVTLKGPKGNSVDMKAPDEMQGFKSLKVGDQVTATYFDALALNIRKPGDPAPAAGMATTTTRKDRVPGSQTRRQQTFSVTVESIDQAANSVSVKGPQGRVVTLAARDPKQLQTLKPGDTVDVTYYESLLIKVSRPKKKK
jgi:Cu/Ag efflux protein CusF